MKRAMFVAATLMLGALPAHAWLPSDAAAVEDAGMTDGIASYCEVDTTSLMVEVGLYIGHRTGTDGEAAVAGNLYRKAKEEGLQRMRNLGDGPCGMAQMLLDGKLNAFKRANATRSGL